MQTSIDNWRERAEGAGTIWTESDLSRRPYEINYKKGPLVLHLLKQRIGEDLFNTLLHRYMTEPINDTPSLLAALEDIASTKERHWFEQQLARNDVPDQAEFQIGEDR